MLHRLTARLMASSTPSHSIAASGASCSTSYKPTSQAHKSLCTNCFYGPYSKYRSNADFSYHQNYTEDRQRMQDEVIGGILSNGVPAEEPWVVYTAGAMGAGKSYTLKWLDKQGYFPLSTFVSVDPDAIKCELPEMKSFIQSEPRCASTLVHKESGYIAEIAEAAAFDRSFNLLVDGSLRDHQWYRALFRRIRRKHKHYRIAILHVSARPETVYQRAGQRSEATGRVVPKAVLDDALYSVPRSVQLLAPYADFVMEINNDGSTPVPLTTEWDEFAAVFAASTSCVTPAPATEDAPEAHHSTAHSGGGGGASAVPAPPHAQSGEAAASETNGGGNSMQPAEDQQAGDAGDASHGHLPSPPPSKKPRVLAASDDPNAYTADQHSSDK